MLKPNKFCWQKMATQDLWYFVGLLATDGNLSKDGRHVEVTAKEKDFLEGLRKRCYIPQKVSCKANGRGQISHRIQIGSVAFYQFLMSVGFMPNKSKIIQKVKVPDAYFAHFLRGVVDGDGSIRKWLHPSNGREQWSLRISTASEGFAIWLLAEIQRIFKVRGQVHNDQRKIWIVKFGKLSCQQIALQCYLQPEAFCLPRKGLLARQCVQSKQGWRQSKVYL